MENISRTSLRTFIDDNNLATKGVSAVKMSSNQTPYIVFPNKDTSLRATCIFFSKNSAPSVHLGQPASQALVGKEIVTYQGDDGEDINVLTFATSDIDDIL